MSKLESNPQSPDSFQKFQPEESKIDTSPEMAVTVSYEPENLPNTPPYQSLNPKPSGNEAFLRTHGNMANWDEGEETKQHLKVLEPNIYDPFQGALEDTSSSIINIGERVVPMVKKIEGETIIDGETIKKRLERSFEEDGEFSKVIKELDGKQLHLVGEIDSGSKVKIWITRSAETAAVAAGLASIIYITKRLREGKK